jgi:hypothetical protein
MFGRRHVGRADHLLLLQLAVDRAAAVGAHHDRHDAEHDQDGAGDQSSDL